MWGFLSARSWSLGPLVQRASFVGWPPSLDQASLSCSMVHMYPCPDILLPDFEAYQRWSFLANGPPHRAMEVYSRPPRLHSNPASPHHCEHPSYRAQGGEETELRMWGLGKTQRRGSGKCGQLCPLPCGPSHLPFQGGTLEL